MSRPGCARDRDRLRSRTIVGVHMTIRAARSGELPAVFDLLEQAFPEATRALFVAQTQYDSTFRLRHGRVAMVDGEIAGYVRIFARTMLVRGVPMAAGGIGSVATRADARSGGIATALMRDAIVQMRRDGMAVSFLFTGLPGFYERVGYRVIRQPHFEADTRDMELRRSGRQYRVRPIDLSGDLPALLSLRRQATTGTTGVIVRTKRTWLDARNWLAEDDGGCFVAERAGLPVAYLRSRCRDYGHQILETECLPHHDGAIAALLAAVGRRAAEHGERIVASSPDNHPLAMALRTLPSTLETMNFRYPMMVRPLVNDPAIDAAFDAEPLHFWNADRI
jgi:predicted N-acetyltransferase YhbS